MNKLQRDTAEMSSLVLSGQIEFTMSDAKWYDEPKARFESEIEIEMEMERGKRKRKRKERGGILIGEESLNWFLAWTNLNKLNKLALLNQANSFRPTELAW